MAIRENMKRKFKIGNLIVAGILIMIMCSCSMVVNAKAMSKMSQHKLYATTMESYAKKVVSSYKKNGGGYYSTTGMKVMYVFADIDKNGTDELIMRYGNPETFGNTAYGSGYGESTTIYTIRNGKVITVLDNTNVNPYCHSSFVRIYKNRSRINLGFSHGYADDQFFKYSNGKIDKKNMIWLTCDYLNGKKNSVYNQKRISYATYIKKRDTLTNNNTGYKMKIYGS